MKKRSAIDFTKKVFKEVTLTSETHPLQEVTSVGKRLLVREIPLEAISPNPSQPRKFFDEASLNDLAESIKTKGVKIPIGAKRVGEGYEISYGERRWRASKIAGKTTIPCIIREDGAEDDGEISLIENIQREDLSAVEESVGIKGLLDRMGYTQEHLASLMGKSQPYISRCLKIAEFSNKYGRLNELSLLSREHLVIASTQETYEEGVSIINNLNKHKLTVSQVRKSVRPSNPMPWSEKKVLARIRSVRSNLNFDFLDNLQLVNDKNKVLEEINSMQVKMKECMEYLNRLTESIAN